MKLYRTAAGIVVEDKEKFVPVNGSWDQVINHHGLYDHLSGIVETKTHSEDARTHTLTGLLPPIENQEIWGAGVTYMRSMKARMDEAKNSGSSDFYDRVYVAERPELFFKASAHRTAGHKQHVRIRRDAQWSVPEPEFTLCINSSGAIVGYTIGNDMSARDIEGENPLYLPQAKTYDYSAGLGPSLLITNVQADRDTAITMEILRGNKTEFYGNTTLGQMKRSFEELVAALYRECSFPKGCFLMTGTGIVPPDDFALCPGDEIRITVDQIGTLVNYVE